MHNIMPIEVLFISLIAIGLGTGGVACLKWVYRQGRANVLKATSRNAGSNPLEPAHDLAQTGITLMDLFVKYVFTAFGWVCIAAGVAGLMGYLAGFSGVNVFELVPK